ncbi:hypothetical protein MAHJHV63_16590 [Mycobacterium avium subsp. hominissuis]|jgi:hypothetical protein
MAREITLADALDLDHPGTEVCKMASRERRSHRLLEGDHGHTVKRERVSRHN